MLTKYVLNDDDDAIYKWSVKVAGNSLVRLRKKGHGSHQVTRLIFIHIEKEQHSSSNT